MTHLRLLSAICALLLVPLVAGKLTAVKTFHKQTCDCLIAPESFTHLFFHPTLGCFQLIAILTRLDLARIPPQTD